MDFLFLIVILIGLLPGWNLLSMNLHKNRMLTYLKRFNYFHENNTYKVTLPRYYLKKALLKHVVLILHGYSASPAEFNVLFPLGKRRNSFLFATIGRFWHWFNTFARSDYCG